MTLHPVLQNFHVDMRDECASPGTMWVVVMASGSQCMSRLHVCVDKITFPFGRSILIGCRAGFTRKYPVAPQSEKAHSTAFSNLIVLEMVFNIDSSCRLLA